MDNKTIFQTQINSYSSKSDKEIIDFLFDFWSIDEPINADGSFKVVASYHYEGKDKNGYDYGYFVDVRSLTGDLLYYPFRLGKIRIYTSHNESYTKEDLWQINVKLSSKTEYRRNNPFILQLANKAIVKPKNSFVGRLENERLIRKIFEETGSTQRDAKNTANALLSIMGDLYSESDERFIFELLQNADDQPQKDDGLVNVSIKCLKEHLLFTHSGKQFSKGDVESISSIGDSTKKNDVQKTGYKGIGFKSVFSDADTVFINSGTFSFAFDKKSPLYKSVANIDEIPWQLKPIWEEKYRLPKEVRYDSDYINSNVGIALQIGEQKISQYKQKISQLLREPRFMLFLRHIGDLKYMYGSEYIEIRKTQTENVVTIFSNNVETQWIISDFEFDIPLEISELMQGEKLVPNKLKQAKKTKISFAISVKNSQLEIVPNSILFTYLPTKVSEFGFPFLINADFLTTASRESIHYKNVWNVFLFQKIGELVVKWAAQSSTYEGYLNILPSKELIIDNPLANHFNTAYKAALESEAFILNHKGNLAKQEDIILDKTGLSKIIGSDLFCEIIATDKCLPSEQIDSKILNKSIFDKIVHYDFDVVIAAIINNRSFNSWFIFASEEEKQQIYEWILNNDNSTRHQKIRDFCSVLPLFKFGQLYFSQVDIESTDYIVTTDRIADIKIILSKIGIQGTNNIFNEKHSLYKYLDLSSEKKVFKLITECDFSQLSISERKTLFFALKEFEGVGEAKIKDIALFKNLNEEFKPLGEMAVYREGVQSYLKPYVICKEDYSIELSKYLISKEDEFRDIIWTHRNDFDMSITDLYEQNPWSDESYTQQLIHQYKGEQEYKQLLPIIEKSGSETKIRYLNNITIELYATNKYDKSSYEYRILKLALAEFEDPSQFSSNIIFNGKRITEFSVDDNVECSYYQDGESKTLKLSLAKLLPKYKNISDTIDVIKNLFVYRSNLDKFFITHPKSSFEISSELEDLLVYDHQTTTYYTNKYGRRCSNKSHEYSWKRKPTAEQYIYEAIKGHYTLKKCNLSTETIIGIIDILFSNHIDFSTVSFVDYIYDKYLKNKSFDNPYLLEDEKIPSFIETWADSDKKKKYLQKYGVRTLSCNAIQFRKLFLENQPIDFIDNLLDNDKYSGLCFLSTIDNIDKPFVGENQKSILLQLKASKACKLESKFNINKLEKEAEEWNSEKYLEWIKGHYPHIFIYNGDLPIQLWFDNNTVLVDYSDDNFKYYNDLDNKRLFVTNNYNIKDILFEVALDKKSQLKLEEDYQYLCVGTYDDESVKDKEIQRLREENEKLRQSGARMSRGDDEKTSKKEMYAAQLEAQQFLMDEFPLWKWPEDYGKCDSTGKPYNYSNVEVEDDNGDTHLIVLKSYKDSNQYSKQPFKINPNEWDYLMDDAELFVYTGSDIKRINIQDLLRNQSKISITFSTANLDIEYRIDTFADLLHYFNGMHFDLESFNISERAESIRDIYRINKRAERDIEHTEEEI